MNTLSSRSFHLFSYENHSVFLNISDIAEALPSSDRFCSMLYSLNLKGCKSLKNLPNSLSKLRSVSCLYLEECKQVDTSSLQIILDGLPSLIYLYLDKCHNLYELPENITKLSLLWELSLQETNVKSLPESIKHLPYLKYLYLTNCKRLQSLPELPASLSYLDADGCTSLERLFTPTPELLEEHIRLESENNDFTTSCFLFYDCPNLDKDALDAIWEYAKCCNERKRATYAEKYAWEEMLLEE